MSGFTGTMRLVRLAARRDRVTLPAWILGLAGFLAATTAMFEDHYGTHPELLGPDTLIVVENPGMRVLGLATGASVGSYSLHRDGLTLAVLAAMMSVLAVVRHTRQSEELGRDELLAAGVRGRYAALTAAVVVVISANVLLSGALALALIGAGQPAGGSLVGGMSIAAVGITFTGVAAVSAQLASTTRGATGTAGACIGLAFLLSALGNMLGTVDPAALRVTSAWPAWLSPLGWSQQMRPFADDLVWPLGLVTALTAALFATAVVLVDKRDVGRGMWPERRGASHASAALLSPSGLVWRLQRGAFLGWMVGLAGFGLVFGALSDRIAGLEGAAAEWYATFGGDVDLLGAYWASMVQIAGMAVAGYVVALLLRFRHDEATGLTEAVLGAAVSRSRWLGAYAVNALAGAAVLMVLFAVAMAVAGGQVLGGTPTLARDLVGAALVQLPAVALLGAVVVTGEMVVPRLSVGLSWTLFVLAVVVGPMFGPSLGLPTWVLDLSPFTHVPNAPAVAIDYGPVLGLALVAGVVGALGTWTLRRRDLVLPA